MFDLYYLENLYYWLHPARNDERIRYQHFYPEISSRYLRRISCIPLYLHGESTNRSRKTSKDPVARYFMRLPLSSTTVHTENFLP